MVIEWGGRSSVFETGSVKRVVVESGGMRVCLRGISVGERAEWDLRGA